VLHLQHVFRALLDHVGDGLSVGWTENQRPEDQHVQGALEHFRVQGRFASWHVFMSMID
jgi:hypothetical protein